MKTEAKVAWALAAVGMACAVAAAYLQGGAFAALTAASVGFNGMAGGLGYTTRA
jgi:uncharacterized membrane protein YjjP (DUF1212 family)